MMRDLPAKVPCFFEAAKVEKPVGLLRLGLYGLHLGTTFKITELIEGPDPAIVVEDDGGTRYIRHRSDSNVFAHDLSRFMSDHDLDTPVGLSLVIEEAHNRQYRRLRVTRLD